jgi:hypothetical protein
MSSDDGAARRKTTISLVEGVAHVVIGNGAQLKLADADALITQIVRAAGESQVAVLLDISTVDAMTRASRRIFFGQLGVEHISALAVVVRTEVSRMIATFMAGLSDPPFPTRVFEDQQQALAWLGASAEDASKGTN